AAAEEAQREAGSKLDAARAVVADRADGIPEEFRDMKTLDRSLKRVGREIKALDDALEEARSRLTNAGEELSGTRSGLKAAQDREAEASHRALAQRDEFKERLAREDFPDQQSFMRAKMTKDALEKLERDTQDFEGKLEAARDRVKRGSVALENLELPDMESLQAVADTAEEQFQQAIRREAGLTERLEQLTASLKFYGTVSTELEALEAEYAVVGRIAQVAGGTNSKGITFQRFVLGALLDDVLIAASERLKRVSEGRYSLQRPEARKDLRKAGGLDLEVLDAHTGKPRSAGTLSGGEGFLASLSLALGLADVVQWYSGGIRLDTIFVDEGFGSLDPETLDLAYKALVDLQRSGRMVGIISHVPELKEQISLRLEVTPGRHGSTAEFVLPGSA
ncbi:SbcC/MukB-like Walker B domain-containing protein, partial [Thermodesulfobacteriota bacterium]